MTTTTRPLFPHLPYAEAVNTALIDAGMHPHAYWVQATADADNGGPNDGPGLEIHAVWTEKHRFVKTTVMPHGFRLVWKHTTGWHVTRLLLRDLQPLPLPLAVDPDTLAETACDLGLNGLPIEIDPTRTGQWSGASSLHAALATWQTALR